MGNAVLKDEGVTEAVQLDVRDALSAALTRAQQIGPNTDILDSISKHEWQTMNCQADNVCVCDPD